MNRIARRRTGVLGTLALVAAAGCVDTDLQGVILDEDVNDPELMLGLVRGTNSELTDWFRNFTSGVPYMMGASADDFTNDGTATSEEFISVGDFRDRESNFLWEQIHESAWAGYLSVDRLRQVLGEAEANASPLTAQAWVITGWSERFLGEVYCEMIYGYGPEGGPLLSGDGSVYDPGQVVPRDSAFQRSLFAMQQALAAAQGALAAGAPTPDSDPIFDPQNLEYKAHGGIAQAAALLGNWALAVTHASQVPDDFVAYEHQNPEVEGNGMHDAFLNNDDYTLWNTPAILQWGTDPRVPWAPCGEWVDGMERTVHGTSSEIQETTPECDRVNGEFRAESNTVPLYASYKYPDEDSDVAMVRGAEMRLIEAEAALLANDMPEFKAQVDRARAVFGLGPITEPAAAGALEWPNAEDDAWSILDRERYLTMHLEGRRLHDMDRWDHPFLEANAALTPRLYEDYGAVLPRSSCYPIADIECDANQDISCPNLLGS